MLKLLFIGILGIAALCDWPSVKGKINALLYFGLFFLAAVCVVVSAFFLEEFSIAGLFL